ncbi:MAG: YjbQ family protein [Candidatus Nanopelagicales bacterium]
METTLLSLQTNDRLVTDLTNELSEFCRGRGEGLAHVFVPHATAGVAIMETGAGSEPDLDATLERLLPLADIYQHRHGSRGHGRDHVVPAFISPSITIPVIDSRLALGTWQSVVLVDSNGDNPQRSVRFSFLPS